MTSSFRRLPRKTALAEINVVPYIDVMLVLLVIFMITAPLFSQGVDVNLPEAKAKALNVKEHEPLIVSVDKQGQYYLNHAEHPEIPILPQQMVTRVAAEVQLAKQQGYALTILVKGDKAVDYGQVVRLMALLQESGVEKIGLMTQMPEKS